MITIKSDDPSWHVKFQREIHRGNNFRLVVSRKSAEKGLFQSPDFTGLLGRAYMLGYDSEMLQEKTDVVYQLIKK